MKVRSCVLTHHGFSASQAARISLFLEDELKPENTLCSWLSQSWKEPEKKSSLFVLSQKQIMWSSQILANKGKFVMATSEEVEWFVHEGDAAGMNPQNG